MDFVSKINFLEKKLDTDVFVKYILTELRNEDVYEIDPIEETKFMNALPVELSKFLLECIDTLNNDNVGILNFGILSVDYFVTMIYMALCQNDDTTAESDSVSIQAMRLFLTLNSGKYMEALDVERVVFDSIFQKMLEVYAERVTLGKEISTSFILLWNKFFLTYNNRFDIEKVIQVFHIYLVNDSKSVVHSFELDDEEPISTAKAIFICFKTIVNKEYTFGTKIDPVTAVSLTLISNTDNIVLNQSLLCFFDKVLHKFCDEKWYLPLLMIILKDIKSKVLYVKILNKLRAEKHKEAANVIINNYVCASTDNEAEMYLSVMKYLIDLPYQDIPDDQRQKLVQRIMTEAYYLSAHKNYAIKETVMSLFINWCQMKDINVRRHMQLMFHSGTKASASRLFEILQHAADLSWKNSTFNLAFITLTCRLFMLNKLFITQYRLKILEMLCYRTSGHCLRPCIPVIIELIKHYALSPHPILKSMINLIINNSLSATNASNYYMKVFFDLLANCMVETLESEVEFSLCNIIMSDDFNCLEMFKAIQTQNLIRHEHITALLQEKILKYPSSWKLLTILLDNIEYTNFPQYMDHYFMKCETPAFFLSPESQYMIQAMTKVFMAKIKNNLVNNEDSKLAISVEHFLTRHLEDIAIPVKHVANVLILILTVNKITHTSLHWMNNFFTEILGYTIANAQCYARTPLTRQLMYLEQMLVLLDINVMEEASIDQLAHLLSVERQSLLPYDSIYAGMLTFYTKVCLKYTDRAKLAIPMLKHAMMTGPPSVQVMAISSLYDLLNLHFHYYDPLYTGLFTLLQNQNIEVKNMSVKMIIKLVNEDHMRLNCNDFITLMLILVERNYKLCLYYVDVLQSDFIHRNQHTIAKYFINLVFYLNKYKDNPTYPVNLENPSAGQDFTYERRIIIYKFLFCNLERMTQRQILSALNSEFLTKFYSGKINASPFTINNILRDVLSLICFNSSQYISSTSIDITDFYKTLFVDMKKDFFRRKRAAEEFLHMDSDKSLETILLTILKILYLIEKSNINMLPQCFSTICFATRAYYAKVIYMVNGNKTLQELYYQLENCYLKFKEVIGTEPLDILTYSDKVEWRLYLGSDLQII